MPPWQLSRLPSHPTDTGKVDEHPTIISPPTYKPTCRKSDVWCKFESRTFLWQEWATCSTFQRHWRTGMANRCELCACHGRTFIQLNSRHLLAMRGTISCPERVDQRELHRRAFPTRCLIIGAQPYVTEMSYCSLFLLFYLLRRRDHNRTLTIIEAWSHMYTYDAWFLIITWQVAQKVASAIMLFWTRMYWIRKNHRF